MAIAEQTIEVYRGEEVTLPFRMVPPQSIAGWTIRLTVAQDDNSADEKIIEKTATITDDAVGLFEFALEEDDTDSTPGKFRFDVWRMNTGHHRLIAIGSFQLIGDSRMPEIV